MKGGHNVMLYENEQMRRRREQEKTQALSSAMHAQQARDTKASSADQPLTRILGNAPANAAAHPSFSWVMR